MKSPHRPQLSGAVATISCSVPCAMQSRTATPRRSISLRSIRPHGARCSRRASKSPCASQRGKAPLFTGLRCMALSLGTDRKTRQAGGAGVPSFARSVRAVLRNGSRCPNGQYFLACYRRCSVKRKVKLPKDVAVTAMLSGAAMSPDAQV